MSQFIYDINRYVSLDSRLIELSGKSALDIQPAVGYATDTAPLILWWVHADIKSYEMFYFRRDRVRYMIMDTDADRCLMMGERLIQILNVGDNARTTIASVGYHGKWLFLAKGQFDGPTSQREGWYRYTIDFEAAWLPNA